jgi:hypothetical protein
MPKLQEVVNHSLIELLFEGDKWSRRSVWDGHPGCSGREDRLESGAAARRLDGSP